MVSTRLDRMVRLVRRWRPPPDGSDRPRFDPDLPDPELRRLRRLIDECIERRGGEVAARRRARTVGLAFSTLSSEGRRRFFTLLAEDYGEDDAAVDAAIAAVTAAQRPEDRREAERTLRRALEPRRERLLRAFAGLDGGLLFLVELREELRRSSSDHPALRAIDDDLRPILESWFDVALLRLERLTWDSPASLLERLIEYEAVHAIESWGDLKGRLGTGRRCYAFLHPSMPDDPLIFVEVALTDGAPQYLPDLLDHDSAERIGATEANTAVFYSISNCHDGLAGVRLGDFLIKSVAEQLAAELPGVRNFVTLSPLPGFRRWLRTELAADGDLVAPDEAAELGDGDEAEGRRRLATLVQGSLADADGMLERARPTLMALAARYLLDEQVKGRARDPVAHFHLTNGASIDRLNWWANPSAAGWERGLGMMVNYRYRLRDIERNHDDYVGERRIHASDGVRRLLPAPPVN